MNTTRFTLSHSRGGYLCNKPGDNDGEYVPVEAVKELRQAADFALARIAEYNAGGTIETPGLMKWAQGKLYRAIAKLDGTYREPAPASNLELTQLTDESEGDR